MMLLIGQEAPVHCLELGCTAGFLLVLILFVGQRKGPLRTEGGGW